MDSVKAGEYPNGLEHYIAVGKELAIYQMLDLQMLKQKQLKFLLRPTQMAQAMFMLLMVLRKNH